MAQRYARYALVTGSNKGIGFEICKLLASKGVTVVLTARNEKRGIEAQEKLKALGLSNNIVFHQLDVLDPASITSLIEFVRTTYGRLDILVNNAGITGIGIEGDYLAVQELVEREMSSVLDGGKPERVELKASAKLIQTFEGAEQCVQTIYYGAKRMSEAFIPLLLSSDSPRIVNVSSTLGNLMLLRNKWAKGVLSNEEILTEERVDEVIQKFLKDMKEGSLQANDWPTTLSAYKVAKAALNAYTRIISKKHQGLYINCVCPGVSRTDITGHLGKLSAKEGAESPVNLALQPHGGPSGLFFYRKDKISF